MPTASITVWKATFSRTLELTLVLLIIRLSDLDLNYAISSRGCPDCRSWDFSVLLVILSIGESCYTSIIILFKTHFSGCPRVFSIHLVQHVNPYSALFYLEITPHLSLPLFSLPLHHLFSDLESKSETSFRVPLH